MSSTSGVGGGSSSDRVGSEGNHEETVVEQLLKVSLILRLLVSSVYDLCLLSVARGREGSRKYRTVVPAETGLCGHRSTHVVR